MGRQLGAPLLVKAVGGGGGRGMKRVDDLKKLGRNGRSWPRRKLVRPSAMRASISNGW